MPAFADEFPSDGYMLEDMVYEEAATQQNIGVYDGTVTATAEYEDILYEIMSGTYLPAGSEGELETCPENSYCPGDVDVTYNETTDQGISSCPSGYPNSAAGASTNTQCYTACTVSMVEHASAVDGNDYYNTDADTCAATACENGYHVNEESEVVEKTPLVDLDPGRTGSSYASISHMGDVFTRGSDNYGLTEDGTWASAFEGGIVYGQASCQPTPHDPGIEWVLDTESDLERGNISPEQVRSELTPISGAAKANYLADLVADIIAGIEYGPGAIDKAKVTLFGIAKNASYSIDDSGTWCYCQMTGFKPTGGATTAVGAAPWVRYHLTAPYASSSACAGSCALKCAESTTWEMTDSPWDIAFRKAVLGALDFVAGGTCEGNEITINWTDAADEDIAANNAGMCTYGGDIRTPVKAVEKPGKKFKGWYIEVIPR